MDIKYNIDIEPLKERLVTIGEEIKSLLNDVREKSKALEVRLQNTNADLKNVQKKRANVEAELQLTKIQMQDLLNEEIEKSKDLEVRLKNTFDELQNVLKAKWNVELEVEKVKIQSQNQYEILQAYANQLRTSVSYRIGNIFVNAAKNPFPGMPLLPFRLIKIVWNYLVGKKTLEPEPLLPKQKPVKKAIVTTQAVCGDVPESVPPTKTQKSKAVSVVPYSKHSPVKEKFLQKRLAPLMFNHPAQPKLVFAITTYNRVNYLQHCLESFVRTCNHKYNWVVIVADDGSEDGTCEYLDKLQFPFELHVIMNKRRYCVGQTNTIFDLSRKLGFDVGFKADDDVVFIKEGWDNLYLEAIKESGYDHLCYMNYEHFMCNRRNEDENFPEPDHVFDSSGQCIAISSVHKCMGAFFSFTPRMLATVGACDEENFPIRGQWHIDYSVRCCRAGFNDANNFFDAKGSGEFIELQNNLTGDYVCSIPWNEDYAKTKEKIEMLRRYKLIDDETRLYVPWPGKSINKEDVNQFFDKIFVLNLDRRQDRWGQACSKAKSCGMQVERFPASDGSQSPHREEWEDYFALPLQTISKCLRPVGSNKEYYLDYESDLARVAFVEKKIGKKAIASPGAWGYLKTMINILEKAIKGNYHSILVLDDDFVCHKRFKTLFKEIVNHQLPDDWKIFQLGALQYDWTNDWITWFSKNLYHCNGSSVASHAVGIHESMFLPLLDFCYKFDLPFDEGALHKVTHLYADECFVCFPNLIIQDVRETDISTSVIQDSEGIKKDNVYRWNLEEYNWGPDFESCEMPGSGLQHNEAISKALKHSKSNDQLKVLHFRETFSPSSETFIYDMLWGLERFTTTDNYMVTFKRFLEDERPFPKTISLEWSDFRRGINEIKEGSNEKRRKELVTIINSINPDLIIAHFGLSAEILYKAMKPDGLTFPTVVSMHGYDVREEPIQRPEYAKIIQEILQQPNVVVTHPTNSLREQIIYNLDIQPDKLYKVNNVAKDIFYKNRKTKFWHSGETLKLINVARMVPIKGQRYLVGALAKFRRQFYENTRLTIVGAANIKYEKELKDYAAELDVLRHIDFLEYLPPAEIVNLLRISDIYIQPSYQESFGMALLEAILVGLPVVATNIGGMPELIGKAPETAALIVPPKDEEAIAQALGLLFTNGALESDNFEYATERQNEFSLEQQMNSLIQAILRICPQQADRLYYSGPK